MAIDKLSQYQKQTRIFLLTDGEVSNREKVIAKSQTGKDNIRVYTFGIGSGCDVDMVEKIAKNGRGSCSLVIDNDDSTTLKALVIAALKHASDLSLQNCSLSFGKY
jgi:uncharacterized protein YegL